MINFSDYYYLHKDDITAKVLADSINNYDNRLTTLEVHFPRIILPEVLTHRMLSRNTASNRAKPLSTTLNEVYTDCYMPKLWLKKNKGMQSYELIDSDTSKELEIEWLCIRNNIVDTLNVSFQYISKQLANRLLEPFQYTTMIISATEWQNFFNLRIDNNAQFEMQCLAYYIKQAIGNSTPNKCGPQDYHLPYILPEEQDLPIETKIKISVARCARVSYKTFDSDNPSSIDADVVLFDKLNKDGHMSPFEHVAKPWQHKGQKSMCGNFNGWIQVRGMIENNLL